MTAGASETGFDDEPESARYEHLRRTIGGRSMSIVVNAIYASSVDIEDLMDDEEVL